MARVDTQRWLMLSLVHALCTSQEDWLSGSATVNMLCVQSSPLSCQMDDPLWCAASLQSSDATTHPTHPSAPSMLGGVASETHGLSSHTLDFAGPTLPFPPDHKCIHPDNTDNPVALHRGVTGEVRTDILLAEGCIFTQHVCEYDAARAQESGTPPAAETEYVNHTS